MKRKTVVVLSGAGMSAESGIRTFRDNNGLWEDHDVMEVASPEGWAKNPDLVNRFYNARRAQLEEVQPNEGHFALARLEHDFDVRIVTQNVDDLHERAGSTAVIHLHGELRKVRSEGNPSDIMEWNGALTTADRCALGHRLRPHIVWFGEEVPAIEHAIQVVAKADIVLVVGTSMQVYPAASLVAFAPENSPVYYIDPNPTVNYELSRKKHLNIIESTAAKCLPELVIRLLKQEQLRKHDEQ